MEIDEDILRNLGLGYRSKYIKSTAQTILNQKIKIRTWENLNYQELHLENLQVMVNCQE